MTSSQAPEPPPRSETPSQPATLTSADILRGEREVMILHGAEAYRLRVTSKDRLILTK